MVQNHREPPVWCAVRQEVSFCQGRPGLSSSLSGFTCQGRNLHQLLGVLRRPSRPQHVELAESRVTEGSLTVAPEGPRKHGGGVGDHRAH